MVRCRPRYRPAVHVSTRAGMSWRTGPSRRPPRPPLTHLWCGNSRWHTPWQTPRGPTRISDGCVEMHTPRCRRCRLRARRRCCSQSCDAGRALSRSSELECASACRTSTSRWTSYSVRTRRPWISASATWFADRRSDRASKRVMMWRGARRSTRQWRGSRLRGRYAAGPLGGRE